MVENTTPNAVPADVSPFEISLQKQKEAGQSGSDLVFWLFAWLGTAISGSFYGLAILIVVAATGPMPGVIVAFPFSMFFGFIIAGFFAVPYLSTVAVVTWAFWLSRFRMIAAAVAGGWTGVIAARSLFGDFPMRPVSPNFDPVVMAGVFGAVGCPLFIHLIGRRILARRKREEKSRGPWQFTLRDLFVHFTALAVLISLWTWYFTYRESLEKSRQALNASESRK
jgi:hypothetical protein